MNEENMGKITIKLSNDTEKLLRKRAEKNKRSISKEIEYIIETLNKYELSTINPFLPGVDPSTIKRNYNLEEGKVK